MIKDFITVLVGWIIGMAFVVVSLLVLTAKEDSVYFNCYISGDMRWGETVVWHGFVNARF